MSYSLKLKRYLPKFGSLANYGIAYTLTSTIQKGVGFIVFMFFASILTTGEYAKFGLSYSIFTIVSALSYSGILESVVSLMHEYKTSNNLANLFKAANSVFVLLTLFSFVLTTIFVGFFYNNNFSSAGDYLFILLGAGVSSYFVFQSIIVRLEEKHRLSILFSFLPALLGYIAGYVAVRYLKSGSSYFLGTFLGVIVAMALLTPFVKKDFKGFSFLKSDIHLIFSRITPYLIISVIAWVLGYGNTFLIKYLFDDLQVATFIFLFTISSILQLVANSMNQVWSPRFFLSFEEETFEALEAKYRKFTNIQGLVLGGVGAFLILSAPLVLNYFTKLSKFNNSHNEMFFLFAGYVVSIPWWHYQNYYMINNKGKSLMNLTLISGIIGYFVWILCMLFLGKEGIYVGFFLQMAIKSLIVYFNSRNHWKVHFDWIGISIGMGLLFVALLITRTY
ncbi:O-antigen/teichoic acid export membrane protein [Pedobacter africanus]|uniref:O-antigen/teichoic acid export membrane protein n=1 Tax=Pedobacter africanus TaxID=151894 RepID=A0ACC6L4C9_9SPHI|nr:oligosaccharide flippase family protein [Pedobacter africanus]MDR6786138.1 O-antigen/teichoic acid export membrane protein [Pedobacter africanus]